MECKNKNCKNKIHILSGLIVQARIDGMNARQEEIDKLKAEIKYLKDNRAKL